MALRDSLHRLVDDLPDTEIGRAERLLQVLKETAEPPLYMLEDAPEGHEPETPEEAEAVAEAWREHREGKSLATEEAIIQRRNGEQFSVALRPQGSSPFDVTSVKSKATTQDILEAIRESRERE